MGLTEVSGTFWVWPREFVFSRKVLSRGQTRPRSSHPPPSRHMTFINKIALLFSAESGTITLIKTRPLWIDCHLRGGEEDAEARGQDWREQRKAGRAEGGLRPPASLPGQGRRERDGPNVPRSRGQPGLILCGRSLPLGRLPKSPAGPARRAGLVREASARPPGRRRARPHPRALRLAPDFASLLCPPVASAVSSLVLAS